MTVLAREKLVLGQFHAGLSVAVDVCEADQLRIIARFRIVALDVAVIADAAAQLHCVELRNDFFVDLVLDLDLRKQDLFVTFVLRRIRIVRVRRRRVHAFLLRDLCKDGVIVEVQIHREDVCDSLAVARLNVLRVDADLIGRIRRGEHRAVAVEDPAALRLERNDAGPLAHRLVRPVLALHQRHHEQLADDQRKGKPCKNHGYEQFSFLRRDADPGLCGAANGCFRRAGPVRDHAEARGLHSVNLQSVRVLQALRSAARSERFLRPSAPCLSLLPDTSSSSCRVRGRPR